MEKESGTPCMMKSLKEPAKFVSMDVHVADSNVRADRIVFLSFAGSVAIPRLWGFCYVGFGVGAHLGRHGLGAVVEASKPAITSKSSSSMLP